MFLLIWTPVISCFLSSAVTEEAKRTEVKIEILPRVCTPVWYKHVMTYDRTVCISWHHDKIWHKYCLELKLMYLFSWMLSERLHRFLHATVFIYFQQIHWQDLQVILQILFFPYEARLYSCNKWYANFMIYVLKYTHLTFNCVWCTEALTSGLNWTPDWCGICAVTEAEFSIWPNANHFISALERNKRAQTHY